jgi:hypothetical protein
VNMHTLNVSTPSVIKQTLLDLKRHISPSILLDNSGKKLELNSKRNRKQTNEWRWNSTLLNVQWAIEEVKGEIQRNHWTQMNMKTQLTRTFETQQRWC